MVRRILIWLVALVLILAVAGYAGFRAAFMSYLRSDDCRLVLNAALSKKLNAKAEFSPIDVQSLDSAYAENLMVREAPAFRLIQADQLRADFRFGFWRRRLDVDQVEIGRLRLVTGGKDLAHGAEAVVAPAPAELKTPALRHFALHRVKVNALELVGNAGRIEGVGAVALPEPGGEWSIEGAEGRVLPKLGPEWKVASFRGRQRADGFHLTESRLRTGEKGTATVSGVFGQAMKADVEFSQVGIAPLLPNDWRGRLTGDLKGTLQFEGQPGRLKTGRLVLSDGEVSALPILDQIAKVTRTERFRRMRLQRAEAEVRQNGAVVEVRQLYVESTGLLRVEGGFDIREGKIEGTVAVGVAPSSIEWLPKGALFTVEREGYVWTDVKLSGLAAHPQEDLTTRIAALLVDQAVGKARSAVETARDAVDALGPQVEETRKTLERVLPAVPFLSP